MFDRLSELALSHSRRTFLIVLACVAVAVPLGTPVAGLLTSGRENFEDSGSQSVRARDEIERATGQDPSIGAIALVRPAAPVRSAAGRSKIEAVAKELASDEAVAAVYTFYNTHDPAFVSFDGRSSYAAAAFKPLGEAARKDAAKRIEKRFAHDATVQLGGSEITGEEVGTQIGKDLARAEMLAFPILFVLALFIFRGVVAALLPLLIGGFSIVMTLLALRVVNSVTPLSVFALNLVTGLGLGLAIDYSLFIVSRYREELERLGPGPDALRRTLATAGRTVAFSSLTVAAAMLGLLVFRLPFLYSMGIGGVFVALISMSSALLVLPALVSMLGPRVNSLALERWRRAAVRTARAEQTGFWYRLSQWVMRRPIPIAGATAAFLIICGIPFLHIKFTGLDATILPKSLSARQVQDALNTEFPPSRADPIFIVAHGPQSAREQVGAFAAQIRRLPAKAEVSPPRSLGQGLWRVDVTSRDKALDHSSQQLVRDIRDLKEPFRFRVGGQTAGFIDQQASLKRWLPVALGLLATTTLLLLFAMTGSVILPAKALVLNVLTLSAVLGILVFIFQAGRLEGLLGYTSVHALDSTQPILLVVIAFGLSTDYAVFLLARIKEARDAGAPNTEAVATGLERTGRIVTAAALLLAIAIGAFSTSKVVIIKEIGVGTALAVLIDASIVRALLVPSLMKLLGEWNWWAPAPLRRLHKRIGLHEGEPARAVTGSG